MFGFLNKTKKEYKIGYKFYQQKRYKEALPHIMYAAEKGYADAQFLLGDYYENINSKEDKEGDKTEMWYEKAALQGHVESQYRLGMWYAFAWNMLGIALFCAEKDLKDEDIKTGNTPVDGILSGLARAANDPKFKLDDKYNEFQEKMKKWLGEAAKQGHKEAMKEYQRYFG